jgi:hypothetical protein
MLFTLITVSIIGAIITGIICDTFGQLRDDKDEAVRYRKEASFVNNIPYWKTPADKMPKERDYGYFLLHLEEQKASGEYICAIKSLAPPYMYSIHIFY